MRTLRDSLNERLKDENFKREYEQIQPEMEIIKTLVAARNEQNMTQSDLAIDVATDKFSSYLDELFD